MKKAALFVAMLWFLSILAASGCGPTNDGSSITDGDGTVIACDSDEDNDGICDSFEGRADNIDSDGDGTPDFQDLDSDNDGIADEVEAQCTPGQPPADSDGDGTPDFRDLDSDNNGIPDASEGPGDTDGDGVLNFADPDDDGDGIIDVGEIGPDPQNPLDTDGDGTPDFRDTDSDNDTISDYHETGTDYDQDGIPDFQDLDTDNDGIPDQIEAGDADLNTFPVDTDGDGLADFRDLDSDNDGLADSLEDLNGNGIVDPGETDPRNEDTDGDGVSDMIEVAAGTDPQDPVDNPRENGDFVFLEPYEEPPDPTEDRLDFSTTFKTVDLYILEDVSGSMGDEVTAVKNSLAAMLDSIICGPGEDPAIDFCIPDVETGAGVFGEVGQIWRHLKDINDNNLIADPGPDNQSTEYMLPSTVYGGSEKHIQAMYNAVTGTCASDPNRIGTACFRNSSLGLIILISDENFREDPWFGGANEQNAYDTMANLGVRAVGVTGNDDYGELATLRQDFENMLGGNPSVQLVPSLTAIPNTTQCNALGGSPFHNNRAIIFGPDAQAANAMTCAIQAITAYLPQDVYTVLVNDQANVDWQGNPVDAVVAFVDYIEIFMDGSAECTDGLTTSDTSGDGHDDTYVSILPGTPVCWKLFVKQNNTVTPSTEAPQMFMATVEVHGEGGALLDERDVYFLVPPVIEGPIPQ